MAPNPRVSSRRRRAPTQLILSVLAVVGACDGPPLPPEPGDAFAPTSSIFRLSGAFTVDDDGTARYRVSVPVPPGRAGMTPEVAISYASTEANGPLGVGFSLEPSSMIAPCSQTLAQDGARAPVEFDEARDRLCLDQNRLVLVSGSYGAAGSVYRTERESFARITAYGTGASRSFVVERRDGRIDEFGATADSRALVEPTRAAAWYLSRERDRSGNTIEYHYSQFGVALDPRAPHVTHGIPEVVLDAIRYTGFDSGGVVVEPTRSVTFEYVQRADGRQGYRRGLRVQTSALLWRIRTWIGSELRHEVRFDYDDKGSATGRTRLMQLRLCANAPAAEGTTLDAGLVCSLPTRFAWQTGDSRPLTAGTGTSYPFERHELTWSRHVSQVFDPYYSVTYFEAAPLVALDFDGDGSDDIAYVDGNDNILEPRPSRVVVRRGGPAEFGTLDEDLPTSAIDVNPAFNRFEAVDFDADGRDDIFWLRRDGHFMVLRSTGTDFETIDTGLTVAFDRDAMTAMGWAVDGYRLADLDGDGLSDFVTCTTPFPCADPPPDGDDSHGRPVINGVALCSTGTWRVAYRNDPGSTEAFGALTDSGVHGSCGVSRFFEGYRSEQGDFDGDGLSELLIAPEWDRAATDPAGRTGWFLGGADGARWRVLEAASDRSVHARDTELLARDVYVPEILDVNGDGTHDVLAPDPKWPGSAETPRMVAHLGTGDGNFVDGFDADPGENVDWGLYPTRCAYFGGASPPDCANIHPFGFDVDGDGRGDLFRPALADVLPHDDGDFVWTWYEAPITVLQSRGEAFDRAITPTSLFQPTIIDAGASRTFFTPTHELRLDADGDGALDILAYEDLIPNDVRAAKLTWYRNAVARTELVTGITDGFGAYRSIRYAPLSDPNVYEPGRDCTYPVRCASDARDVVAEVRTYNGAADPAESENAELFHYRDGRVDLRGRGWLGFAGRAVHDVRRGLVTTYTYDNQTVDERTVDGVPQRIYPFAGLPFLVQQFDSGAPVAGAHASLRMQGSRTLHQYALAHPVPGTYHVREEVTEVAEFEAMEVIGLDLPAVIDDRYHYFDFYPPQRTSRTTRLFDDFGNELTSDTTRLGGSSESTTRIVDNDPGPWLLGLVRRETSASTSPEGCLLDGVHTFDYDARGLLSDEHREPSDPQTHLHTHYDRDRFGNVQHSVVSSSGEPARDSSVVFDGEGYSPIQIINALGHTTQVHVHASIGVPSRAIDPNGARVDVAYDGFGRVVGVARNDGSFQEIVYDGLATAPIVELRENGAVVGRTLSDALGRPVRELWPTTSGLSVKNITYDPEGHVARVTRPIRFGEDESAAPSVTFEHDGLGRLRFERGPVPGTFVEHWAEPSVRFTRTPRGHVYETRFDAQGLVRETLEPLPEGGRTQLTWCAPTLLSRVVDDHGNVTLVDYDHLGRRIRLNDPDTGVSRTTYTAFDELDTVRDEGRPTTRFRHDVLGRLVSRSDGDGDTSWTWDSAPSGVGKLASATSAFGVVTSRAYDSIGRVESMTQQGGGLTLTASLAYDSFGRLRRTTYPTRFATSAFSVENDYDAAGYLVQRRASTGAVLWKLDAQAPDGQVEQERFGNGSATIRDYDERTGQLKALETLDVAGTVLQALRYTYDPNQNVATTSDLLHGVTELFGYDSLDRLVSATTTTQTGPSIARRFRYDTIGNMIFADDRPALAYGDHGRIPHALTGLGTESLRYDRQGNLERDGARRFEWTAFGLPRRVDVAGSGRTSIYYDAFQTRTRTTAPGVITDYAFGFYESRTVGGKIEEKYLVHIGSEVAEIVRKPGPGGTRDIVSYVHADRLGTPETIEGPTGVSHMSFDAFGARRDFAWTTPATELTANNLTTGFTGHENDDALGLVNMNGRLYDPRLRHFTSADPFVEGPGQGLNRYSYVLNNPLTLLDPSGFQSREPPAGWTSIPEDRTQANCTTSGCTLPGSFVIASPTPSARPTDAAAGERAGAGVASGEPTHGSLAANPRSDTAGDSPGAVRSAVLAEDARLLPGFVFGPLLAARELVRDPLGAAGALVGSAMALPTLRHLGGDMLTAATDPSRVRRAVANERVAANFLMMIVGGMLGGGAAAAESPAARALALESRAGAAGTGGGSSARALPGLAELPAEVAVPIRAGEPIAIPRALTPDEMAALTNTTGNIEFSQTFSGGQYWLTRADFATPATVLVRPWGPGTRWISHTHPAGYSGIASAADRLILRLLGQRASRVVRPDGSSSRFGQ